LLVEAQKLVPLFSFSRLGTTIAMETLEIKREVELLSERLGKTQDYL